MNSRKFRSYGELAKALRVTVLKATQLVREGTLKPKWAHDGMILDDDALASVDSGTFGVVMSVRLHRRGLFG